MSDIKSELKEASQLMHSADISELMEAFSVRRFRRRPEPWHPRANTGAEPAPKENAPTNGWRASLRFN